MTEVHPKLWLGDAKDSTSGMTTLNVASDLEITDEDAKCPLVDGPGNTLATYHAAVLVLYGLVQRGDPVLVVDHGCSGRCVVVAIMYLHLTHRMGWEHWLGAINTALGKEVDPHPAHREAFNRINWRLLNSAMEER